VTGDETWVSFVNVDAKEQSKQRMHTHSKNKPKQFKQMFMPGSKLMATVFWDRKGMLMVEIMEQRTTVMSEVDHKILKQLCKAIYNKRNGMLTPGVVLFHDNVCPCTAAHARVLLEHFNWSCLTTLLTALISLQQLLHVYLPEELVLITEFNNNEELMESVKTWLCSEAADLFDRHIQNLIPDMPGSSISALITMRNG
jgi:hypothetical protein